jgi:hypothetical protein
MMEEKKNGSLGTLRLRFLCTQYYEKDLNETILTITRKTTKRGHN